MSVNSITGEVAAFKFGALNSAGSLDKPVKETPSTIDQSSNRAADAGKVSPANKQSPVAHNESDNKPVRAMSHMVESYNQHGKVRIKFMDSNNSVIYQIPTEMVAKMEDQMLKPETSANIKG